MTGAAIGLAALAWLMGPNDHLLVDLFERADALEHRLLPTDELLSVVSPLWIVPHDREDLPKVFFVDGSEWSERGAIALMLGTERLLPELRVPRLFVARQYFRDGDPTRGLVDLEPLAVDQADHLLRVWVELYLNRKLAADPDLRRALASRARELMVEVPEGGRVGAYLVAQGDFAAHLLSIRHEIGRHQRRKKSGDLCALLGHPVTLFGFWRRSVEEGAYPGLYSPAGASEGEPGRPSADSGRSRMTRSVLTPDDKRWMMEEVLDTDWTGDPERDFRFLCPS